MKIALFLVSCLVAFNVFASKVEVDVVGMTCGMCVEAITKEFKKTEKVENISVNLEDKKARFSEIKGKRISDAEVKAAIKAAGYEAVKIRRQ